MTFTKAAWAIDGATINSALARAESFASASGQEGIVLPTDLKVSQLDTPGNGVKILAGNGLVLNRYQTVPNQMYTTINPSVHLIGSGEMPASTAGLTNYIVCVSIGDPEFSQSGHPWMTGSDPAPGTESTFTYVRPIVMTETAFNARTFPALALARIARPGSTTTITNAMITDLRVLSKPRTKMVQGLATMGSTDLMNAIDPTFERWPDMAVLSTAIPSWARKATITGFIEGVTLHKSFAGYIYPQIEGTALIGNGTNVVELGTIPGSPNGVERRGYNFSGVIDVSSVAGTTKVFSLKAKGLSAPHAGALEANINTDVVMTVFFEETTA